MKITYFGHSAFQIDLADHTLLIDPFISGNPHAEQAGISAEALACDAILLTHGHADHLGDTEAIAKRTGAQVVANFELASYLGARGCNTHPMNHGGGRDFPYGRVSFTLAHHSSSIILDDGTPLYLGNPAGILLQAEGKVIYHAGDTALFSEMEWIGRRRPIDIAMLPVGDNFTMGMEDAAEAARMLKPRRVIPVHYNTFPPIQVDIKRFPSLMEDTGAEPVVLGAGESLDL